jgi:2'-5' RNA ligase
VTPQTIIAYWCLPCEEDGQAYAEVINAFATAQGGVRFTPHISLGSLSAFDPNIEDVITALRGLTVQPTDLSRSDVFTKSLYVDLAANAQLLQARDCLARREGFRSSRAFAPHISLCYGPPVNEDALMPAIQALLTGSVRINRVQAVEIRLPVETHADIAAWVPVETFRI